MALKIVFLILSSGLYHSKCCLYHLQKPRGGYLHCGFWATFPSAGVQCGCIWLTIYVTDPLPSLPVRFRKHAPACTEASGTSRGP